MEYTVFTVLLLQWNLFESDSIGREILCRNRQGVGLHNAENQEKGSKGKENDISDENMDIHVGNTGAGLDRFYCSHFLFLYSNFCLFVAVHFCVYFLLVSIYVGCKDVITVLFTCDYMLFEIKKSRCYV